MAGCAFGLAAGTVFVAMILLVTVFRDIGQIKVKRQLRALDIHVKRDDPPITTERRNRSTQESNNASKPEKSLNLENPLRYLSTIAYNSKNRLITPTRYELSPAILMPSSSDRTQISSIGANRASVSRRIILLFPASSVTMAASASSLIETKENSVTKGSKDSGCTIKKIDQAERKGAESLEETAQMTAASKGKKVTRRIHVHDDRTWSSTQTLQFTEPFGGNNDDEKAESFPSNNRHDGRRKTGVYEMTEPFQNREINNGQDGKVNIDIPIMHHPGVTNDAVTRHQHVRKSQIAVPVQRKISQQIQNGLFKILPVATTTSEFIDAQETEFFVDYSYDEIDARHINPYKKIKENTPYSRNKRPETKRAKGEDFPYQRHFMMHGNSAVVDKSMMAHTERRNRAFKELFLAYSMPSASNTSIKVFKVPRQRFTKTVTNSVVSSMPEAKRTMSTDIEYLADGHSGP
ncbi:uncharacterized protein LOC120839908 [Ixodes scapularis]|uniref:uncharacterized protein LOC120839908 n=1 Tax=Ixodes scapularis TaxID=6945 RepID=UPI001A9F6891|nr:uncharacterized protein LOC120839908 [Ixodes scapularis]